MIRKSIKLLCNTPELIENYDMAVNDKTQLWDCHHRLEITNNGDFISRKELIKMNLYFHRPPE